MNRKFQNGDMVVSRAPYYQREIENQVGIIIDSVPDFMLGGLYKIGFPASTVWQWGCYLEKAE